jgi:phage shock protein PspC (stress-responsive transcriptional regulator)
MNKLYRSRKDRKLFGVCGGLAEAFNIDVTLLRLVVVVTTFFSAGTVILFYIIAALVMPSEPRLDDGPFAYRDGYGDGYGGGYGRTYGGGTYYGGHGTSYGTGHGVSRGGFHTTHGTSASAYGTASEPPRTDLDEMMRDVETKALRKEIEELKAKLAQFEKAQNEKGEQ